MKLNLDQVDGITFNRLSFIWTISPIWIRKGTYWILQWFGHKEPEDKVLWDTKVVVSLFANGHQLVFACWQTLLTTKASLVELRLHIEELQQFDNIQ